VSGTAGRTTARPGADRALALIDGALDTIVDPRRAFSRVAARPRILPPLLFVVTSTLLMYVALGSAFETRLLEALGRAGIEATPRLVWLLLSLGGALGSTQIVIVTLVAGLITHAAARLSGGSADAHRSVACYALATVPGGFKAITVAILASLLGAENVPLATGGVSSGGGALLALFDPFSLWAAFLLGIGLATVHGLSAGRAFGISLSMFMAGWAMNAALAAARGVLV